MSLLDWLDYRLLGNTLLIWASGLAVLIGVWAALGVGRAALVRRLSRLASRGTASPAQRVAAEVVVNTRRWFALLVALFVSARLLAWSPPVATLIENVLRVGVLVQIALWLSAAVAKLLSLRRERLLAADPSVVATMDVFGFVLRVAIWVIVILVGLQSFGVNVTALMAGLGIGGVAVALAAQRVLSDVFASLSIVLDKPFLVGDLLDIDGLVGTVEHVGLKTTRLRSLSGEQLIVSNDDLLGCRIRNFGRMAERRVLFSLGVTYGTPPEQLRRIPEIVRGIVEAQADVRFDRAHFSQYGDFALIFEIVYVVLSGDNHVYMDAQQRINLAIYERFAADGIQFAFPTHTLHLASPGAGESLDGEQGLHRHGGAHKPARRTSHFAEPQ